MYVAVVPYSPPTDKPWNSRATSNSAGAHAPIVAYDGKHAMTSEPAHIISTEITIEVLRPRRSAMRPNSQPPSGRIKKPAANTPAVFSSCTVGSLFGKNAEAK